MRKGQSGFTLIELMVVLAVLGVLTALALPSYSEIVERRKLNAAGENLFADLMYAKTEAIKRNLPIRLTFTGTGTTWCYGIAVNAACDCTDNVPACEIESGVQKIVNQSDYEVVSVDAGDSTLANDFISFTPLRGFVNQKSLQFSVGSGAELRVVVSSLGRIRLCSDTTTFGHPTC